MVRGLSDQLMSACSSVVSSAQGLPSTVQDQLTNARRSAEELRSSLGNTSIITPLLLERSRHLVTQVLIALHCLNRRDLFCCISGAKYILAIEFSFYCHLVQLVLPLHFYWCLNNILRVLFSRKLMHTLHKQTSILRGVCSSKCINETRTVKRML